MITISRLEKSYGSGPGAVRANRRISLTIYDGEFVVFAGPSGSGKTTLLNMLGALDSPTSGSLTINGNDLTAMSPRELSRFRRDHLGFVFQRSNLVSSLTVMDNALLQLRLQGRLTDSSRRAVEELIDRVGLGDKKTRLPRDLSGGEQQRAAIIRAVASAPALVVADEPTASLDAENAAGVLNVMRALNYELGTTIVVSSHDERVIRVGRRIVRLTDGRVVSDTGSTRER